ncbi:MAG TPA: ABC transporter substrate-binding protein [Streptosporangiaceae bacterium]|nr:ABC transporter substrate-binding protein [Streptosporangiaceae bacterium]
MAGLAALVLAVAACSSSAAPSTKSTGSSSQPHAGGVYTILANSNFGTADPAQNYTLEEWQLLIDTHDGLVQFQRVGGLPGTKLVPDLAVSIPQPTDGGKTYTFHIRRGIKFSNGEVMKPSDFVKTFERQFTVPGPTTFYSGIVGASKCTLKVCNLSSGVVANDSSYTLTFHLTAPDPQFLDKLALPFAYVVPASTSPKLTGNSVPPGTGPYMWKSYNPNTEAALVRNPYFHVWNKAAQPAGYPNEIIEKYGLTVSDEVTEVENGQADEVFDGDTIPADRLAELNSPQYASQVHVNSLTADWYWALNTKVPPFNNLKARQAINYAANRSAYVKIAGGPSLAVPTCQILPPNFPGYKPYCPYTSGTNFTKWTGPDLAKARQLVAQSGTKGMKVVVNSTTDELGKALAAQMVSDLDAIGYNASTQLLTSGIQYPFIQNSDNIHKWNVTYSAWYQDYPAASDFLNVLLGCGSIHPGSNASPNIAEFCDPAIQAQMNKANILGETNPTASNNEWATVDREVTDQAPWVDMYNPKQIDFLAKNVHGYEWNPQWYILIDQQWLG